LSYIGWGQRGYSKPRPPRYEYTRRNLGADGANRNLFSGLEAQGTPYIPRPLIHKFRDGIQLSKTRIETHHYCVASKRKRVRQNASSYR